MVEWLTIVFDVKKQISKLSFKAKAHSEGDGKFAFSFYMSHVMVEHPSVAFQFTVIIASENRWNKGQFAV